MDGEWVEPPRNWWQRLLYRFKRVNIMPENPQAHPACAEIIEYKPGCDPTVIYRRN
jgi:hypothetical protein